METVGFGVIGAGILGENHAQVFMHLQQAELIAVCDVDADRAQAVAMKCGAKTFQTDYRELLDNPEIQAVSIATPDYAHRDIALAAAQAGKHILCEKPLAMTVEDAQAIVDAAHEAGVRLMVDFHNRVNPTFIAARQYIASGAIGKPAYAYIRLSNTLFVPLQMLSWSDKTSALWFLCGHTIDLMRFLLQDNIRRVYAVTRSGILENLGINTPDFHIAIAEFENGTVVTFENAWILPESQPIVYDFKLELLGSEGAIYANPSHHGALELHSKGQTNYGDVLGIIPTGVHRVGGFVMEAIARFVDSVVFDQPVLATGEDGLEATRVLSAIEKSAESGIPVDL